MKTSRSVIFGAGKIVTPRRFDEGSNPWPIRHMRNRDSPASDGLLTTDERLGIPINNNSALSVRG